MRSSVSRLYCASTDLCSTAHRCRVSIDISIVLYFASLQSSLRFIRHLFSSCFIAFLTPSDCIGMTPTAQQPLPHVISSLSSRSSLASLTRHCALFQFCAFSNHSAFCVFHSCHHAVPWCRSNAICLVSRCNCSTITLFCSVASRKSLLLAISMVCISSISSTATGSSSNAEKCAPYLTGEIRPTPRSELGSAWP